MSIINDKTKEEIRFYTELLKILNIFLIATAAGTSSFAITGTTDDQVYNIFGVIGVMVVVGTLVLIIFVYAKIKRLIKSIKTE